MKNTYEVTLLNQKFNLRTESDAEHVKEITEYVNGVLQEIRERGQNLSTQNIALLGALTIAERMLSDKKESRKLVTRWKNRLESLAGLDS